MLTSSAPAASPRRPTILLGYLVLAVTLGLTLLASHMAAKYQRAHELAHFDSAAYITESQIKRRMEHYVDILESVRALFYATPYVAPHDFQTFIEQTRVPQRYPGVQAMGYIHHLHLPDAEDYIKDVRRTHAESPCGYPEFMISPQGVRSEYQVVAFVEPIARNLALVGRDMMVDPACREAMEKARDTGQATISGIVRLQGDAEEVTGFSLFLPLYSSDSLLEASLQQRRDALTGFVFASFVTSELFRGIFGDRVLTDIDFELFDNPGLTPETLLYDDDNVLRASDSSYQAAYSELRKLDLFGRTWNLYFSTPTEFHHQLARNIPLLILAAGVLTSVLLFLLTHSQIRSVHQRWEYASDLEFQATHDSLTHLPNRTALYEKLGKLLKDKEKPFALFMLDLDGFKEINDTLGHHSGDLLLKELGPRMLDAIGPDDLLVRLGGDEFAILIVPISSVASVMRRAEKLLNILRQPYNLEDIEVQVDASIGIALAPDHGHTSSLLLRHADVAMYSAKRRNLNVVLYEPELDVHSPRRLSLMSELARAIEENQLELYYQPKIRLRDNRCIGLEALIRWNHPGEGMIPPGDFIPQAESGSIIKPLTYWVIEQAIRQCRAWQQQGLDIEVAVNISARNLMDRELPARVAELIHANDLLAQHLEMEVTESAIITDPERAYKTLTALHDLGVKISIDDFGTGYTSMSHLKRLPVSALKIDRCFVADMEHSDNDAVIVNTVKGLAHDLGMAVVAEGVEDNETLITLKVIDCDYAQGFFICRPLPVAQMTDWLNQSGTDHNS